MSIYSRFVPDDVVEATPTVITTGLWTGDTGSLENRLRVDTREDVGQLTVSAEYYIDVFDTDPAVNPMAEVQFSITYGHINGGGAPTLANNDTATLPTKAIYSQYRNLLLDPTDAKFSFKGIESDHIYVINLQRSRFREQLDPGNWQLPLSGANGLLTFVDNSGQTLGALTANSKAGRVFEIVSGTLAATASNADRYGGPTGPGYGLVYPDLGIIVLNPDAIGPAVGFFKNTSKNTTGSAADNVTTPLYLFSDVEELHNEPDVYAPITGSAVDWESVPAEAAYNHAGLFVSLNLAVIKPNTRGFLARSAETITSTHYFVRLRNKEFNYSNNPTFYNSDNGSLNISEFKNNPQTYITAVGLYNDQNELLAVAKLSKPVRKSFDEEILLRARLDF